MVSVYGWAVFAKALSSAQKPAHLYLNEELTGFVRKGIPLRARNMLRENSMPVLQRIAYFKNRRDEIPNRALARQLAAASDHKGIRKIAKNLWHENPSVQSDCLKVLYEIGFLQPKLIANYAGDFLKLLQSKNNRLVWGSMIALSTLAEIKAEGIFSRVREIKQAMASGSVITLDNGIKILAIVASKKTAYQKQLVPFLLKYLASCRPKDIPQYAEKILIAVNAKNKKALLKILNDRLVDLKPSQLLRVKKVIKAAETL